MLLQLLRFSIMFFLFWQYQIEKLEKGYCLGNLRNPAKSVMVSATRKRKKLWYFLILKTALSEVEFISNLQRPDFFISGIKPFLHWHRPISQYFKLSLQSELWVHSAKIQNRTCGEFSRLKGKENFKLNLQPIFWSFAQSSIT